MPNEIEVRYGGETCRTESFTFPGGELQVRLPGAEQLTGADITVIARLQSAEDIIRLDLLTEIFDRFGAAKHTLVVPYFPGARQDRITQVDSAFSLERYARLVNNLGFDRVIVCDPHSAKTAELGNNYVVVTQLDVIRSHDKLNNRLRYENLMLVAPDAGSVAKTAAVAAFYGAPFTRAVKVRDPATNAITDTKLVTPNQVKGREVLICDDIIDGGRTFVALAKVLRKAGATKVYLYGTHGIFCAGLDVFSGVLDAIYTTDTFLSPFLGVDRPVPLHVSKLDLTTRGIYQ